MIREETLWDHLEELRCALIGVLLIIGCSALCSFFFYREIIDFFTAPLQQTAGVATQELKIQRIANHQVKEYALTIPAGALVRRKSAEVKILDFNHYLIPKGNYVDIEQPISKNLMIFGPLEGVGITLKVCIWTAVVISSPLWAYFLFRFIVPGLYAHELQLAFPFLSLSFLSVLAGFFAAYLVTIPYANSYLQYFNSTIGGNYWSLASYLDYTLFLVLANGLVFQTGVILFFMVKSDILPAQKMREGRRHAYVIAFIAGALLTPPDVLTQIMTAIPLIVFYEGVLLYAGIREGKRLYAHIH